MINQEWLIVGLKKHPHSLRNLLQFLDAIASLALGYDCQSGAIMTNTEEGITMRHLRTQDQSVSSAGSVSLFSRISHKVQQDQSESSAGSVCQFSSRGEYNVILFPI